MMCKVCLLADMRTERRNRGIYRNMLRLRAPRNAAIRPHRQLISVSLTVNHLQGNLKVKLLVMNMDFPIRVNTHG